MIVACIYVALFSALEQTHCGTAFQCRMWFYWNADCTCMSVGLAYMQAGLGKWLHTLLQVLFSLLLLSLGQRLLVVFIFYLLLLFCFCFVCLWGVGDCFVNIDFSLKIAKPVWTVTTTTKTKNNDRNQWLNHFHAVFCLFLFCCFFVFVLFFILFHGLSVGFIANLSQCSQTFFF